MQKTRDFHYRSVHDRDAFWREEASRVHWETPVSYTHLTAADE